MGKISIPQFNAKPTLKKEPTPQGKKFEKKFSQTMNNFDVELNEVDLQLNEKEQSLKKQIWDLAKMEALVHSDPKLSGVYNEMSEDGEEKYGYHYNETIMNIIFNEYVLNSADYLQKYKNAIPVKKKRRDKSGINQLQQKGEEKQDKKKDSKEDKKEKKDEAVTHNNSLEGVQSDDVNEAFNAFDSLIETLNEGMDNNGAPARDGEGDFDDRGYLNKRIEKKYDTMKNTDENVRAGIAGQHKNYSNTGSSVDQANIDAINDPDPLNVDDYDRKNREYDTMSVNVDDKYVENPFESEIKEAANSIDEISMRPEHNDPTKEEMIEFLKQQWGSEYNDFDAEEAIYWFAYEWHGGQNSNLYSALSSSEYKPSPLMNNANDLEGLSQHMYNDLASEYQGAQFTNEEEVDETTGAASANANAPVPALGYKNGYDNINKDNIDESFEPAPIEMVQQAAEKTCDAVKMESGKSCEVHDVEVGSFELSYEGEKYAGGSYDVDSEGTITLVSIPKPIVIGTVNSTVEELVKGFAPIHDMNESEDKEEKREEGDDIDETNTSTSSGQYSTPYAWASKGKKSRHSKKPAYPDGEIVGENYFTKASVFKDYYQKLEESRLYEGMNSPNDYSRVPMAEGQLKRPNDFANKYKNIVKPTGKTGKFRVADLLPVLTDPIDKQDVYDLAEYFANRMMRGMGIDWSDLPDINSLWDVVDNGHQDMESFLADVKEMVQERISDVDSGFGSMFGEGNVNEHHLETREEKIEFILKHGQGKFGDAEMLNDQDDETIDRLYSEVENTMVMIDPENQYDFKKEEEELDEKSTSKAQQKAMGAAYAAKKGDIDPDELVGASKEMYNSMSKDDLKDFASTKHKGLPNKVKKEEKSLDEKEIEKLGGNWYGGLNVWEIDGKYYAAIEGHNQNWDAQENLVEIPKQLFDELVKFEDGHENPIAGAMDEALDASGIVQYDSEKKGEEPFEIDGDKWQYVYAIYPDGKKDIGVYKFGQDLVYSYDWFQENVLDRYKSTDPSPMMEYEEINNDGQLSTLAKVIGMFSDQKGRTMDDLMSIAKQTADIFFGGNVEAAIDKAKTQIGESMALGMDADATTMKLGADNGTSMKMKTVGENRELNPNNKLSDFGTSKEGVSGFNGNGEKPETLNYKSPEETGAPKMDNGEPKRKVEEQELDEDGYCRKDEIPVVGKVKGEKGACKKKDSSGDMEKVTKGDRFNLEKRKEREKERNKKLEKKNKDMENSKKEKVSEDKKPSTMVMLDRLKKDNQSNFNSDMKDSNSADLADDNKELRADDQYSDVDDPQKLSQEIEKDKLKQNKGEAFDNEGDSTNDNNKEIPKRNHTDEEQDMVTKDRGLGMQDIVYDNKPSDRFEERMEKDMGEEIYKQRQEKMEYRADAPMYNKDTQPVDDKSLDKVQHEKNKAGYNVHKGFHNESITGRYVDIYGKKRIVDFKLDEAVMVDDVDGLSKINVDGLGNTYTQKVDENVSMRDIMNSFEFYFDNTQNKVVKTKAVGMQRLSENEEKVEKPVVNEDVEKMKKLMGYDPSKHVNTHGVKKNRGF